MKSNGIKVPSEVFITKPFSKLLLKCKFKIYAMHDNRISSINATFLLSPNITEYTSLNITNVILHFHAGPMEGGWVGLEPPIIVKLYYISSITVLKMESKTTAPPQYEFHSDGTVMRQ